MLSCIERDVDTFLVAQPWSLNAELYSQIGMLSEYITQAGMY